MISYSEFNQIDLLLNQLKHKTLACLLSINTYLFKKKPIVINVKVLNLLKSGSIVDIKSLVAANIVKEEEAKLYGVKILGDGDIKHALTIKLPISKSARAKITKAGGKVEN